jgi:peptidoglycan biosynthesis protein MviN/MurJ (putative lipid II flippase)
LATAIACYVDFILLFIIFRMRYGLIGGKQIFNSFAKIAMCSAIMGVACWLGMRYTAFTMHSRFIVQLLTFLGLLGGATALYIGLAWLFRCHELEEIYGIATRRRTAEDAGLAQT